MRKTKSAQVSTSLVDRALIERVRGIWPRPDKPLATDLSMADLEALCALAEDVLDGRAALTLVADECKRQASAAYEAGEDDPSTEWGLWRASLDAILSHVTQEEPR